MSNHYPDACITLLSHYKPEKKTIQKTSERKKGISKEMISINITYSHIFQISKVERL